MARRATIQLKVHGQIVQSIPLDEADIECLIAAEQRLRTLEALQGLGAGFALGARDLDVRGGGDLLGADQAGYVRLIGTSWISGCSRRR